MICGDYLETDVREEFGVEGFDLIMENPPFNKGNVGRNFIWDKFIKKGIRRSK